MVKKHDDNKCKCNNGDAFCYRRTVINEFV